MKKMRKIISVMLCVCMVTAVFTGCKKTGTKAIIEVKDYGTIEVDLLPDAAPKAVENFVALAKKGYYNGTTFHRVLNEFMIQGGDPTATGMGGESIWGKPFEDEFSDNARNFTGALSMANSGANTNGSQFFIVKTSPIVFQDENGSSVDADKNTLNTFRQMQGSTEVIDYSDADSKRYAKEGGTPWLDNKHTVFGYVTKGLDIVQKVMDTSVDENGKPATDVVITSITIK